MATLVGIGGVPATVGHLYAFGSTLEQYEIDVLGAPARGRKGDDPFDHATGKGWVKYSKGQYEDALTNKGHQVVVFLVEATGGISPPARKQMHALTRRARGRGAIDRTVYGRTRFNTKSFYKHHEQQIVRSVVIADAAAIRKKITHLRQKAHNSAAAAAAAQAAPAGGAPA